MRASRKGYRARGRLALLSGPLSAHDADHASGWIGDHELKNVNGVPCCGASDCAEFQDDAVTETHARLRGRRLGLLSPARVPAVDRRALGIGGRWRPLGLDQGLCAQDRTLPSQDDHYWRCKSASERTCFLVPPRDF